MKHVLILLVLIIVTFIPSSAYAWDEPSIRWPTYISERMIGSENDKMIPPQLDSIQGHRWFMAFPSAKPRLAVLYGIPKDIAEEYGALYLEVKQIWE